MPKNAPDSLVLICTATVAASAAVGDLDNVSITDDESKATVTDYYIPSGVNYILTKLTVSLAADHGTSDPHILFWKGAGRTILKTLPLSNFLNTVVNMPRFSPRPVRYLAGEKLWMQTSASIANDATADSIRYYLSVEVQNA